MADCYTQASVAFTTCAYETALLEEAFLAAQDWDGDGVTFAPSVRFLGLFPPTRPDEAWSGLQAIFDDPDYPTFGAKIEVEVVADNPRLRRVMIYSLTNFEVGAICTLIRTCCAASLMVRPIGFEYAMTCSKALPGQFGGGWCVITADAVETGCTSDALAAALGQAS